MVAAFFVAKLFGIISQNNNSKKVTIHVAIQIEVAWANHAASQNEIAIVVARAAVYTFTKLFQIRIVISSLSLFSFIFLRALDQYFLCLTSESILCLAKLIKASSVPEKNADKKNNTTNKDMRNGSIIND